MVQTFDFVSIICMSGLPRVLYGHSFEENFLFDELKDEHSPSWVQRRVNEKCGQLPRICIFTSFELFSTYNTKFEFCKLPIHARKEHLVCSSPREHAQRNDNNALIESFFLSSIARVTSFKLSRGCLI